MKASERIVHRRHSGHASLEHDDAAAETWPKSSPIVIDPNGNLKLVVDADRVLFRVDANALRRSSKVFEAMLFGGFRESEQGSDWTVELPEDDAWAMQTLLHAAHANFADIPKTMDVSELYSLTVLTNKYNMTHCLQPWARKWASPVNNPSLHSPVEDRDAVEEIDIERIWVLHELGMYRSFEDMIVGIALNATATPDGDIQIWVTESSEPDRADRVLAKLKDTDALIDSKVLGQFIAFNLPLKACAEGLEGLQLTSYLGIIEDVRNSTIATLLEPLHEIFALCTDDPDSTGLGEKCASSVLGIMIRCLCKYELWPLPELKAPVAISAERLGQMVAILDEKSQYVLAGCDDVDGPCDWEPDIRLLDTELPQRERIAEQFLERLSSQAVRSGCEESEDLVEGG
ncbi:hypothetical protein VP1G_06878 [Cytospora mali]|uniref:BTB domain-containing protein n=1 Tax=Cytospora mali TaxID=578113 RepID=A0A194V6W7_CYTMA|nr:hypothetical protein VP1G_06878 [Valsa mali var. pyri (nom. inval.)]